MGENNLEVKELEKNKEENVEKTKENKDNEKNLEASENKKEVKKTNKKGIIIGTIIIVAILFVLILLSTIFALININNDNIINGVKIEGIDVSGLSKEEAKTKIEELYKEKNQNNILLQYQDYETDVNAEVFETNYNIEEAVNEAISIGKTNNIFVNNYNIFLSLIGKKNIELNMTINEEITKQKVEEITADLPGAVKEPDYCIEEDKLIITKGQAGIQVDTNKLIEEIKNTLKDVNIRQGYIEIPVINKTPEDIDIEKIHEEIYKEVQDAYYTKDPFTIHPEVEGVDFNVEEAKKILEEDKEQYEIQLTITKPKITTAQIGSEAFPDLLATYSTRYDGGDVDRTTNLRIACQKINEKVVLPGETFSYNKTLGVRSAATGYKNAKVYENGQVVDGIGGGICQISSTLYNSVLMANLDIVERKNHQFVTSYTPAGRDATVVYGMTDFRFKNSRTYAIKIKASASNGIATVSVYGIKEENEYTISFSTKTISTIPYTVKYVEDNTLAAGTEKVKQKGANGLITETYITKSLNGKVVSTKLLSRDTYNAMQRIILKGTKGTSSNTNNNTSTTQEQNKTTQNQPAQNINKTDNNTTKKDNNKSNNTNNTINNPKDTTTKENNATKTNSTDNKVNKTNT